MSGEFHGLPAPQQHGKTGTQARSIFSSGSTLLTGLVSWWDLDEESGTRYDAIGSYDLTDVNTVGYESGKIGNAASFVSANSEALRYAPVTPDGLWPSSSFTISMWIKAASMGDGKVYLASIGNNNNGGIGIQNAAGKMYCFVKDGTTSTGICSISGVAGAWFNLIYKYDASAGKCYAIVNNGTPIEAAASGYNAPTFAGTEWELSTASASGCNASIDLVGVWHRALTADEITELYNSGDGKSYPFT